MWRIYVLVGGGGPLKFLIEVMANKHGRWPSNKHALSPRDLN